MRLAAVGTRINATSSDRATAAADGHGDVAEQLPGLVLDEQHGNEHGQVGQRRGEHGAPDFLGAP